MSRQVGASTTQAALPLITFWALVTAGRVLFALVQRWLPTRGTCHLLPFVLAGLGCSALLPLTLSAVAVVVMGLLSFVLAARETAPSSARG